MFLNDLKNFLEKIDRYRDKLLFAFIRPCWPRTVSPNQITFIRVIVGGLLFILLFFLDIKNKPLILSLFFLGILTDIFDGSVARCLNKITELGEMLDPVADRILLLPIAIYSLYWSHKWLLLTLLLIEIINGLVSLFSKSKGAYDGSNIFGKARMVLLCIVFVAILIVWPETPSALFINLLWASLIFSLLSIFTQILVLNQQGAIKNKILTKQLNKYDKTL